MILMAILVPEQRTQTNLMQVCESICDKSVVDFKVTHRQCIRQYTVSVHKVTHATLPNGQRRPDRSHQRG